MAPGRAAEVEHPRALAPSCQPAALGAPGEQVGEPEVAAGRERSAAHRVHVRRRLRLRQPGLVEDPLDAVVARPGSASGARSVVGLASSHSRWKSGSTRRRSSARSSSPSRVEQRPRRRAERLLARGRRVARRREHPPGALELDGGQPRPRRALDGRRYAPVGQLVSTGASSPRGRRCSESSTAQRFSAIRGASRRNTHSPARTATTMPSARAAARPPIASQTGARSGRRPRAHLGEQRRDRVRQVRLLVALRHHRRDVQDRRGVEEHLRRRRPRSAARRGSARTATRSSSPTPVANSASEQRRSAAARASPRSGRRRSAIAKMNTAISVMPRLNSAVSTTDERDHQPREAHLAQQVLARDERS